MSYGFGSVSLSVLEGSFVGDACKFPAEVALVDVAAACSDFNEGFVRVTEFVACVMHTEVADVLTRRHLELFFEFSLKGTDG